MRPTIFHALHSAKKMSPHRIRQSYLSASLSSCRSDAGTTFGAAVIKSCAAVVLGKAMQSLILSRPAGRDSIRDCIAFPKTTAAQDLMTAAPNVVPASLLQELKLALK